MRCLLLWAEKTGTITQAPVLCVVRGGCQLLGGREGFERHSVAAALPQPSPLTAQSADCYHYPVPHTVWFLGKAAW